MRAWIFLWSVWGHADSHPTMRSIGTRLCVTPHPLRSHTGICAWLPVSVWLLLSVAWLLSFVQKVMDGHYNKQKDPSKRIERSFFVVPPGIEPGTHGFSVDLSQNCVSLNAF